MRRASGVCQRDGVKVKTRSVKHAARCGPCGVETRNAKIQAYFLARAGRRLEMEAPLTSWSGRSESVGAGLLSGGGCGGGLGLFAGFASALDTCCFAAQVAEVVEACASNVALAGNFDGGNGRRMEREDAFDAGTKADAADSEGGTGSAALFGDDH